MADEIIQSVAEQNDPLAFRKYRQDEPHKFDAFWNSCPQGHDRYGNPVWQIGTYWVSRDAMRFLSFGKIYTPEQRVIVFIAATKRFTEQQCGCNISRVCHQWKRRIETGWYAFVDPITQEIYP